MSRGPAAVEEGPAGARPPAPGSTSSAGSAPPARDERGFALVAALWLVAAVSFVLAAMAAESRPERHIAANARQQVRARAAARAGLAEAMARLHALERDSAAGRAAWNRRLSADGPALPGLDSARVGAAGRFGVGLRDLGARLPLNTARVGELRALFQAVGASFSEASVAAQSVADWRDPDGLHRPNGAEWDDHYRHLEPAVRPRNAPFPSVDELRRVRGVDRELVRSAAPHLTVRSDGPVNVNTAPEPVLVALEGVDRMAASVLLRRRRLGRPVGSLDELARLLPASAAARLRRRYADLSGRVAFEPRRVVVRSTGRVAGTPAAVTVEALAVRRQGRVRVLWRVER